MSADILSDSSPNALILNKMPVPALLEFTLSPARS